MVGTAPVQTAAPAEPVAQAASTSAAPVVSRVLGIADAASAAPPAEAVRSRAVPRVVANTAGPAAAPIVPLTVANGGLQLPEDSTAGLFERSRIAAETMRKDPACRAASVAALQNILVTRKRWEAWEAGLGDQIDALATSVHSEPEARVVAQIDEYLETMRLGLVRKIYGMHALLLGLVVLMIRRREGVGAILLWPLTALIGTGKASARAAKRLHERI